MFFAIRFSTERKKESEKLAVAPKKSSARRQKALQAEKVGIKQDQGPDSRSPPKLRWILSIIF